MTFEDRVRIGGTKNKFSPEVRSALIAEWENPEPSIPAQLPAGYRNMTVRDRMKAAGTKNRITKRAAGHMRSADWYATHKKRHISHMVKYQKAHRIEMFPARRNMILKKRYGITSVEYDAMLAKQNGACAICHKLSENNRNGKLFVDHCHDTGRVRGLLCLNCNRAIASLTVTQLLDAVKYLEGK